MVIEALQRHQAIGWRGARAWLADARRRSARLAGFQRDGRTDAGLARAGGAAAGVTRTGGAIAGLGRTGGARAGFTLIELLVVLAILALLMTIAAPRYIHQVERAREATLRSSLKVMREAIDKFYGDQGRLPQDLDELVARNYLKAIPLDPVTDKRDTWIALSEAEVLANPAEADKSRTTLFVPAGGNRTAPIQAPPSTGLADVRSGAPGNGNDGTPYLDW